MTRVRKFKHFSLEYEIIVNEANALTRSRAYQKVNLLMFSIETLRRNISMYFLLTSGYNGRYENFVGLSRQANWNSSPCHEFCPCHVGYFVSSRPDVDECSSSDIDGMIDAGDDMTWTHDHRYRSCPTDSRCHNTIGSYECLCDLGFYQAEDIKGHLSCAGRSTYSTVYG